MTHKPTLIHRSLVPLGAVLLLLGDLPAAGQPASDRAVTPPPPPVTLGQEQAVRKALDRHPALKAARHRTAAARHKVNQAKTGWFPRITIETAYLLQGPIAKLNVDTPLGISITEEVGSLHNFYAGVTVGWRVYDFGARDVRARAAKAAVEAAKAEGDEQKVKIAFAVRAAYLAAVFFDAAGRVTARSLAVAERELADERVKKRAGVGNDLSIARANIRVADLGARLTRMRQERERALVTLRLLLGLKPATPIALSDSLEQLGQVAVKSADTYEHHPAVQRLTRYQRAARLQRKTLKLSFWPTLDLFGSFKWQYPKNFVENDKGGIAYMAGLKLTWRVFDGDLMRRQRHELSAQIAQMEALRRAATEEIQRKTADAAAKMRAARAALAAAQRSRRAAGVYLKAAQTSRKAGLGTFLELRKAEEAVDRARLAILKAYFDAALARAEHWRAQGVSTRESE